MMTNPLASAEPVRFGRVTAAMLYEMADNLNRCAFVRDSGLPYFVANRLQSDGTYKHVLDRKIEKGMTA
jgi:hypothetical protein